MNTDEPTTERYEIRVAGHLDPRWVSWFDGLNLTNEEDGTTVLSGSVADQAALHGLLRQLRDLGVTLLSLNRAGEYEAGDVPTSSGTPIRNKPSGANS